MLTIRTLYSYSAAFALGLPLMPVAAQTVPAIQTTPVTQGAPVTRTAPSVPPIPITQNPPLTAAPLPTAAPALPAAGPSAAGPALLLPGTVPASYKLGVDDVVSVRITEFPEQSAPEVAVAPDGTITLPLLDAVPVVGLTTAQLQAKLTASLKTYIKHPIVTVALIRKRPQFVTFSGFVGHAGPVDYRPGQRVIDAIATSGGALATGSLGAVTVQHADGTSQTLDLSHPETKADSPQNIVLQSGDVVYVPEQRSQITVSGFVPTPGSFPYKEDMTVRNALTLSGTPTTDGADLSHATLTHDGRTYPLDLYSLLYQNNEASNVKLAAGDVLYVPELTNKVFVFGGGVSHDGYYAFKPGDHLLDALKATVPSGGADLAKVTFSHFDKQANVVSGTTLDVQKFLNSKAKNPQERLALNPPLQIGDIIYVPVKGPRGGFLSELAPLTAIAGLASSTSYLLR